MNAERFARVLGWCSIGLGLVELVAPKRFGNYVGLGHRPGLLRLYGLREIGHGAAILTRRDPALGVWSRVGGGTLDLAALGAEFVDGNPKKVRVAVAAGVAAAIGAVDVVTAQRLSAAGRQGNGASGSGDKEAKRVITIGKSAEELDRLWREPDTLPRLLEGAAEVTVVDAKRTRWKVNGPLGRTLQWETEVVEDRPGELLSWASASGADVTNEGSVSFRPGPPDWGTEVTLDLRFSPPAGPLGAAASLLPAAVPKLAVAKALRRFKHLAETGEIAKTEPQPAARDDKS
ncbi:MAG: SRPBCC family protein [Chloroflexota bacterium]|nr:SRPBCC family protein [Chloroflexota bacterium]